MDNSSHDLHDVAFVLKWLGTGEKRARRTYRRFVEKGIDSGRQPDLIGAFFGRQKKCWRDDHQQQFSSLAAFS